MNRNLIRLIIGAVLAVPVAGGLFFIMQYLIASADPKIDVLAVGSISAAGNVSNYVRGITGIRVLFDTTITFATTPRSD